MWGVAVAKSRGFSQDWWCEIKEIPFSNSKRSNWIDKKAEARLLCWNRLSHHWMSDLVQWWASRSGGKSDFSLFFFVKKVEPSGDFKPFAPACASLVIKRSMSHPDCSGMLEKELSDPYVPPRMPQLSGLFRSHPNQCVSLEPAASGEQVHKSPPSYLLGSAASSRRGPPAPQMWFGWLLTGAAAMPACLSNGSAGLLRYMCWTSQWRNLGLA